MKTLDHDPGSPAPAGSPAPVGSPDLAGPRPTVLSSATTDGASLWEQAFPAAAWRTVLGERTVTVRADGDRAVLMAARSGRRYVLGCLTDGRGDIILAEDGPEWVWVEGDATAVTWTIAEATTPPLVTVVIPTHRNESDVLDQAARFARMDIVRQVIVVDQGATLAQLPAMQRLQGSLPGIRVIAQPNLGGSGGYARGLIESMAFPDDAILVSDDDAVISEESLRRMVLYQSLAAVPTIVGTPLFSADEPSVLIAASEAVRLRDFQWHSSDRLRAPVDLRGTTPEQWSFLCARTPVNYTGWWATLFPPGTVADLGLPAPYFLKWDDAEYGLRATQRGYLHAVLAGTAAHHPTWDAYRTQMSWTARALHRNRLATAAAYTAWPGVIASSLLHQCKHILAGHHITAALWDAGIDSFLAGPEAWLGTDLASIRSEGEALVARGREITAPRERLRPARRAPLPLVPAFLRATATLLRRDHRARVVVEVTPAQLRWRTTLGADAFIVTTGDRGTVGTFQVRGSTGRSLLLATVRRHAQMALRWHSLRRRYRRALQRATTPQAWSELFDRAASSSAPIRENSP